MNIFFSVFCNLKLSLDKSISYLSYGLRKLIMLMVVLSIYYKCYNKYAYLDMSSSYIVSESLVFCFRGFEIYNFITCRTNYAID